jgi:hypothetical protein
MKGSWWALIALLFLASVALRSGFLFLLTVLLALIGAVVVIWGRFCPSTDPYKKCAICTLILSLNARKKAG